MEQKHTKTSPLSSSMLTHMPQTSVLRIRPQSRRGGNLLLDLSIAGRLTLGFLTAAIIAALVTGVIGLQRAQSLNRQSDFYQNLLQINTSLNTGENFLQLMNTEMQELIAVTSSPNPSRETITATQSAAKKLADRYNIIIHQYTAEKLLAQHPEQVNILVETNHTIQITQQRTLTDSALRSWRVYQAAQEQIMSYIQAGNIVAAQSLLHVQGEPTNADAQSALRALISFDQRLASSIREAASIEERDQLISTIGGVAIAFILIGAVGWFISNTLVSRLKQLRHITQQVEQGQLNARVTVIGRDEIADVSASFNAMLEAIVGLLKETRQQRDALTNAADHLFSDMRIVSAGDLRINAPVSNDPIGMLANAFNFTVGRFRRFVLRTQGTIEQLDVISRQEVEHSENFLQNLNALMSAPNGTGRAYNLPKSTKQQDEDISTNIVTENNNEHLTMQIKQLRGRIQQLSNDGISKYIRSVLTLSEQNILLVKRINKILTTNSGTSMPTMFTASGGGSVESLQKLEQSLQRMTVELQNAQKNIVRGFLDIDTDLTRLSSAVHVLKGKPSTGPLVTAAQGRENSVELAKQSIEFAREITSMARQLAALTQELRIVTVSFQLDTTNASVSSSAS